MRQFDVFRTPSVSQRTERPYVLVLQHNRLDFTRTIIAAPPSRPQIVAGSRVTPRLNIGGAIFALITDELSAIDRRHLRGEPLYNLESERYSIMNALDAVFSAAG
jgi:toxin CcdB